MQCTYPVCLASVEWRSVEAVWPRYGCPVAVTPQVTLKAMLEPTVSSGMLTPAPCKLTIDSCPAPTPGAGQVAVPLSTTQVGGVVHDNPVATGSFNTLLAALNPLKLATVMV
jgi:hypothetical protein